MTGPDINAKYNTKNASFPLGAHYSRCVLALCAYESLFIWQLFPFVTATRHAHSCIIVCVQVPGLKYSPPDIHPQIFRISHCHRQCRRSMPALMSMGIIISYVTTTVVTKHEEIRYANGYSGPELSQDS